ncbi:MAG: pseudouridine-5'-phosphate glycosidase [Myxococcota bacterium]
MSATPVDALLDLPILSFGDEVAEALATEAPVVALESTLLAHGLPAGRRREVALRLEEAVRSEGATPATVAIVDRRFQVGLDGDALERVIGEGATKASLRDLAPALALGGVWATTVASTMAIAQVAGLRWFATGGIGGVHRGAETTFDESADLTALAKYPVAVVCAGAKSVLDLPRTLERLETLGVPVVGFGTDQLPAFYHGASGLPVPVRVNEARAVAAIAVTRFDRLGEAGVLVVQAPPASSAQEPRQVDTWIERALARAAEKGVQGREVTPFLLAFLAEVSEGNLVETNIALVEHNARLAARCAVADVALRTSSAYMG